MKKLYCIFVFIILIMPTCHVKAEKINNELIPVAQTEKYYKTVVNNNSFYSIQGNNNINNYTVEITKEEYDSAFINNNLDSATVETTYKKLVSTIYQNGSKYRYKAELTWKNFPSTRSYDIIGIGYYPSVTINTGPYFSLYYCKTDGNCYTTTSHYPQTFTAGAGASFKLPTGSLTQLVATLYFDVVKTNNVPVYGQIAAADYSHAVSTVTSDQSKDYTIGAGGISLGSSISSKYDSMSAATATWTGTW